MTMRHRRTIGRVGGIVGLLVLGLSILAPPAQPSSPLDHGKLLYVSHCAGCHGLDGSGNGPAASGMKPPPTNFKMATVATLSDNAIQQAILVGKPPVMRGYATILSPSEINALVLYLRSLSTPQ